MPEITTQPKEERRRFQRLRVSLPVTFRVQTHHLAAPLQGRGVLRDVSLSGAFFYTDAPVSLAPDLVLELSILCHVPGVDRAATERLSARGKVIRLENFPEGRPALGVAVSFLESLSFRPSPPEEMF